MDTVDLGEILLEGEMRGELSLPPHRRCASHTLSRVAVHDVEKFLDGDKTHEAVISKCKVLWNYQARSTIGRDVVEKKPGAVFPVPNETRWNSKYDALNFIVGKIDSKQQDLRSIFSDAKKCTYFTHAEVTWLREYIEVCDVLYCQLTGVIFLILS